MGGAVSSGVGTTVETADQQRPPLEICLLGPMAIRREGAELKLPGSRKVRALLAYLILAPYPQGRAQLCDLLWDVADDPRGELRWCLSRIRSLIGERIIAHGDTVALDLAGCAIDAVEAAAACREGLGGLPRERLRQLADRSSGEFLDGLVIERHPAFETWLVSQRRRFREIQAEILAAIADRLDASERLPYLDRWIEIAPFDLKPHELLLATLASEGRLREADEHMKAAARAFAAEGLDAGSLRRTWEGARSARTSAAAQPAEPQPPEPAKSGARRASIAVMPFNDMSALAIPGGTADALVYDIITRLSKLRTLRVIAQGTMFALRERPRSPGEIAAALDVDYVVNGTFERIATRLIVRLELTEARTNTIVWADSLDQNAAETLTLLEEIGTRVVASIEREVETLERNRAILKPPSSLDAWEAHHRGLWHMFRFTKGDNDQARHFFETAISLDPTFARAYAGLSFTHFQSAFQHWADRDTETELAYRAANQGLMADDRDPAAHLSLGRAHFLRKQHDQSVAELQQAVDLSPSFAIAHYSLAFVQCQSGDPLSALAAADQSQSLSPFDPMLFGILASRAIALVRLGRFDEAADWAARAAARPNAHAHIMAIAALCLAIAGRLDEGRAHVAALNQRYPGYRMDDFFIAFHLAPADQAPFRDGAKRVGLE